MKEAFPLFKTNSEIISDNVIIKRVSVVFFMFVCSLSLSAQKSKVFHVKSPDGKIDVTIDAGAKITWSVIHESNVIIAPSAISLTLGNGEVLGDHPKIISAKTATVNTIINTPFYKKKSIIDNYNQLTLQCKGDYGIIVRAYNDGDQRIVFSPIRKEKSLFSPKRPILILIVIIIVSFAHVRDFAG